MKSDFHDARYIAVDIIKIHEGFRSHPYKCPAGKLTIGYGRNIEDNGIDKNEAEQLLHRDIVTAQKDLYTLADLFNFDDKLSGFSSVRKAAFLDFIFNLGVHRAKNFKKMWHAVAKGDWKEASVQLLDSRYASQVGDRARTLAYMIANDSYSR